MRDDLANPNPVRSLGSEILGFGGADCALITDGELVAALRTAAGKNLAAILGLHALAKTMCLRALAVIRLKRTFWHLLSLRLQLFKARRTSGDLVEIPKLQYIGLRWRIESRGPAVRLSPLVVFALAYQRSRAGRIGRTRIRSRVTTQKVPFRCVLHHAHTA